MYFRARYREAGRMGPGQAIPTEVRQNLGRAFQAIPPARRIHLCPRLQLFLKIGGSGCQLPELTCVFDDAR